MTGGNMLRGHDNDDDGDNDDNVDHDGDDNDDYDGDDDSHQAPEAP